MPTITIGGRAGNTFSGMQDAVLLSSFPTNSLPSETSSGQLPFLLRPDLSGIPAGSTITNAFWTVNVTSGASGAFDISPKRVLRAWVEGQASWNNWSTGNAWTTPGALGAASDRVAAGSCVLNYPGGFATGDVVSGTNANLIADIQAIVNGSQANNGWRFEEGLAIAMPANATAALRPQLTVVYNAPDSVAPILTSPTGTATGATTATGTVSTDEANGTLYRLASTNATELAATVKASGLSQAVTATGVQNVTFTGLTPSTTYYIHYVHTDAAGNDSTRVSSTSFTTPAAGDTTPPTLTSPTATATGATTATGSVSTNEANGTLHYLISTNPTELAATVKSSGASQAVTATGVQNVTLTGLTGSTVYYIHYVHTDAAGNDSARVSSASITTPSAGGATFTSEPLKRNNGTLIASKALNYVAFYNDATGALVLRKTGVSTDSSGIFSVTDPALVAATFYKVDWETVDGERRMPRKLAA